MVKIKCLHIQMLLIDVWTKTVFFSIYGEITRKRISGCPHFSKRKLSSIYLRSHSYLFLVAVVRKWKVLLKLRKTKCNARCISLKAGRHTVTQLSL